MQTRRLTQKHCEVIQCNPMTLSSSDPVFISFPSFSLSHMHGHVPHIERKIPALFICFIKCNQLILALVCDSLMALAEMIIFNKGYFTLCDFFLFYKRLGGGKCVQMYQSMLSNPCRFRT